MKGKKKPKNQIVSWRNWLMERLEPISLHIQVSTVLFALSFLFGLVFPEAFEAFRNEVIAMLQEISNRDMGAGIIWFIILNNIRATFLSLLLGFTFLFPLFSILLNGYLLGAITYLGMEYEGLLVFGKIIPHGIFELPAIVIAAALGLYIGSYWEKKSFRDRLEHSVKTYLAVVLPLLLVAGVIEGLLIFFLT